MLASNMFPGHLKVQEEEAGCDALRMSDGIQIQYGQEKRTDRSWRQGLEHSWLLVTLTMAGL